MSSDFPEPEGPSRAESRAVFSLPLTWWSSGGASGGEARLRTETSVNASVRGAPPRGCTAASVSMNDSGSVPMGTPPHPPCLRGAAAARGCAKRQARQLTTPAAIRPAPMERHSTPRLLVSRLPHSSNSSGGSAPVGRHCASTHGAWTWPSDEAVRSHWAGS